MVTTRENSGGADARAWRAWRGTYIDNLKLFFFKKKNRRISWQDRQQDSPDSKSWKTRSENILFDFELCANRGRDQHWQRLAQFEKLNHATLKLDSAVNMPTL
jgi:hypothetical protein